MKQKIHITIGIPVFNEEPNIGRLLISLVEQEQLHFTLDKVIVVCDGSTDNTPQIVNNLSKKHRKITCVYDPIRRGVTYRTQQLMDLNTSEVLLFFDGDTMPSNSKTTDHLAIIFKNTSVQIATARLEPILPTTFFEHMLYAWRSVWSALVQSWKNGNNIYNFRGVGIAIRKDFAKSVRLDKNIIGGSSHYLYLSAKSHSFKTAFCSKAIIQYRLATKLNDYLLQLNRGQNDSHLLRSAFSKIYDLEYIIPLTIRLRNILKCIMVRPFETLTGITFNLIIGLVNIDGHPSDHNGAWKIAKSTKTLISK